MTNLPHIDKLWLSLNPLDGGNEVLYKSGKISLAFRGGGISIVKLKGR